MKTFRIQFGPYLLEWDRDYGIDRRRGWTAVKYGRVLAQFVSLWKAVRAFRT
jgi:hypothetical protein